LGIIYFNNEGNGKLFIRVLDHEDFVNEDSDFKGELEFEKIITNDSLLKVD